MDFSTIFYYDINSPSFLSWAQERRSAKNNSWVAKKVGDFAGTFDKTGYWKTSLNGKSFLVHRIVWQLFNGDIADGMVIDHIDRDSTNNKIENLRMVTTSVNSRNSSMYSTNSTGITGVTYWEPINRPPRYSAFWREDGKLRTKSFSVAKYGKDLALQLATEYRKSMIEKLNEQGAKYSTTHGDKNEK